MLLLDLQVAVQARWCEVGTRKPPNWLKTRRMQRKVQPRSDSMVVPVVQLCSICGFPGLWVSPPCGFPFCSIVWKPGSGCWSLVPRTIARVTGWERPVKPATPSVPRPNVSQDRFPGSMCNFRRTTLIYPGRFLSNPRPLTGDSPCAKNPWPLR
jgi:hypothetical protein